MQRLGAITTTIQRLGELVNLGAGTAEDDGRCGVKGVEHAAERGHLVRAAHHGGDLAHAGS